MQKPNPTFALVHPDLKEKTHARSLRIDGASFGFSYHELIAARVPGFFEGRLSDVVLTKWGREHLAILNMDSLPIHVEGDASLRFHAIKALAAYMASRPYQFT